MCRLIVWAKADNASPDPVKDATKFKRGMVVAILDDDVDPGSDIFKLGWWRVVDIPGESNQNYEHLLGGDPPPIGPVSFTSGPEFPRKRISQLDLDAIEAAAMLSKGALLLVDDKITMTTFEVATAVQTIAAVDNPLFIGTAPEVIG